MPTYKLCEDRGRICAISFERDGQEWSAPFDMDNTDCQKFVGDWKAGAEVLNPDGSPAPYSDAAVRALGLEPAE